MKNTLIAIDRPLRDLLSALAVSLGSSNTGPVSIGQVLLEDDDHRVELTGPETLTIKRRFAGFNWRFNIEINQLADIVTGAIREIPMERLDTAQGAPASMNDGAIGRLLGSLGFDEGEAGEENVQESAHRKPQLTGLEDGLEEEADFGSVSEMDLDDFLAAYEAATQKPKKPKNDRAEPPPEDGLLRPPTAQQNVSEPEIEIESQPAESPKEEVSPSEQEGSGLGALGRLFAEMANVDESELEDDGLDGELTEEEITSARGFLDLLINNDKMEVVDGADIDALATGLAPILAQEERHRVKVEAIIDWLLDQDDVEDVYATDDELVAVVRAW